MRKICKFIIILSKNGYIIKQLEFENKATNSCEFGAKSIKSITKFELKFNFVN